MGQVGPSRRGGLMTPLILIVAGLAFLAGNLGLVTWSFWEMAIRLWPVLIIAVGLDVMLGRAPAGSVWAIVGILVMFTLLAGTVGAIGWFLAPRSTASETAAVSRPTVGVAIAGERVSQPLEGAERGDVNLSFGAGSLKVGAQSEPSGLIEGTVTQQEGETMTRDFHVSDGTAFFVMRSRGEWMTPWDDPGSRADDRRWDIRLNPEVPLRLKVDGGVGKVNLDLAQLKVVDLEVRTGVGKADITLPRYGQLNASVEGGIGKTTILIPMGMAARIQLETGLSSVDVMGNYVRQGEDYVSPGYADAVDRVDLVIKGGIGKITIQEYGF
ncbi:MAG: LiaI-LiaF-like domain-containing protein [Sphingomonadaceae bacterium]